MKAQVRKNNMSIRAFDRKKPKKVGKWFKEFESKKRTMEKALVKKKGRMSEEEKGEMRSDFERGN